MNDQIKRLLWSFLIEGVLYLVFLSIYFFAVLRFLDLPLTYLYHLNPFIYAGATLIIIMVQGIALETLISLIIKWLGLKELE